MLDFYSKEMNSKSLKRFTEWIYKTSEYLSTSLLIYYFIDKVNKNITSEKQQFEDFFSFKKSSYK